MHMENALTTVNFSDFFVKIIAYLASHCRAKPHYFPTKATIGKIETNWITFFSTRPKCHVSINFKQERGKLASQFYRKVRCIWKKKYAEDTSGFSSLVESLD